MGGPALRVAVVLLSVAFAGALYWFPLRRLFGCWGARPVDISRRMPGDASLSAPNYAATLAITVHTTPDRIWPWLLQLGYQRGGLYSYDWLDRLCGFLDRPSATRILPEFQHLAAGDVIPVGRGPGFPVVSVEPGRALVLGGQAEGFAWVWQFGLYPVDEAHTRLVSRSVGSVPKTVRSWLLVRVLEPTAFLMTRRMLIGIKHRAEALAGADGRAATRAA